MGITGGWVVIESRLLRGFGTVNVRSGMMRGQTVNVGRFRASPEADGQFGFGLGPEVRVGLAIVQDGTATAGEVSGLSGGGGTGVGNSGADLLGRGGGVGAGTDDVRSGMVRFQPIDVGRFGTASESDGELLLLGNLKDGFRRGGYGSGGCGRGGGSSARALLQVLLEGRGDRD